MDRSIVHHQIVALHARMLIHLVERGVDEADSVACERAIADESPSLLFFFLSLFFLSLSIKKSIEKDYNLSVKKVEVSLESLLEYRFYFNDVET